MLPEILMQSTMSPRCRPRSIITSHREPHLCLADGCVPTRVIRFGNMPPGRLMENICQTSQEDAADRLPSTDDTAAADGMMTWLLSGPGRREGRGRGTAQPSRSCRMEVAAGSRPGSGHRGQSRPDSVINISGRFTPWLYVMGALTYLAPV